MPAGPGKGNVGRDKAMQNTTGMRQSQRRHRAGSNAAGIEFHQDAAGQREPGQPLPPAPQRQRDKGDHRRVDVPAAGEFP